jgi:hypothetical protein
LAPVPTRNTLGKEIAVALILTAPDEDSIIVTGATEILDGVLTGRFPISRNGLVVRTLSGDLPIQISRDNLSYIIPSQETGVQVARFSSACSANRERIATGEKPTSVARPGSYWMQGGSIMRLIAMKTERKFVLYKASEDLKKIRSAVEGAVQFEGKISAAGYSGTAYVFTEKCGLLPYAATGTIENGQERVVLTGNAPRVDAKCHRVGTEPVTLTFDFMKTPP